MSVYRKKQQEDGKRGEGMRENQTQEGVVASQRLDKTKPHSDIAMRIYTSNRDT